MMLRMLTDTESLDSIWEELVYTEARLLKDEHAKDLAPVVAALEKRLATVRAGQLDAWRAEIIAQSGVDAEDDALDDGVRSFARDLLHAEKGNRESARFKRYFPIAPNEIVRLGLESELKRVETWPESLAREPDKPIKAHAKPFASRTKAGGEAVEERRATAGKRADHRVRQIVTLVEGVNAARVSLFGMLASRIEKHGLDIDWPARFFRRTGRSVRSRSEPAPATPGATPPGT